MARAGCDCEPANPELVSCTRAKMPKEARLGELTEFFKVIGDDTRLRTLAALREHELCVSDIANVLDMTKSAVSHQLKVLADAGLVKSRRDGKNVYYSLDEAHVAEIFDDAMEHVTHRSGGVQRGALYIIRHGKTDWNERSKLQGQTDIPLNDEGRRMAEEAAARYAGVHFDVCFCSPLVRARETAEILLRGRDVPICYDERLKEMSFGVYEGIEHSFMITDCPVNTLFYSPEKYTVPVEGGESVPELMARTGSFLREKAEPLLAEGKDVLIVGHGAMNSSIIIQVRDLPVSEFWSAGIENCKLMQLS